MDLAYRSQEEAKQIRGTRWWLPLGRLVNTELKRQESAHSLGLILDDLMLANMSLVRVFNIRLSGFKFDDAQLDLQSIYEDRSMLHFQISSGNPISEGTETIAIQKCITVTEIDPKDREVGQHDYNFNGLSFDRIDTFSQREDMPAPSELRRLGNAMLQALPTA